MMAHCKRQLVANLEVPPTNLGTSECGTWSHAVISSLGARARAGVGRAAAFPCRTLSDLNYSGLRSATCDVSSRWVLTMVQ